MKKNKNIEKKRLKALRYFLGFSEKPKDSESLAYLEKLNMMKKEGPVFLSEEEKKRIWEKIKARLNEDQGSINKKIQKKGLPYQSFFVNRYFIPAFTLLFLVISTIVYLRFYPFINEPSAESIILTIHRTDAHPAISEKTVDLSKSAFSSKTNQLLGAKIGKSLNLWFSGIHNLKAKKLAGKISLSLSRGVILVNYKNQRGRLPLEIQTAKTLLRIAGTEFILAESDEKTSVLVREGKVLVIYNNQKLLINKNSLWQSGQLKAEKILAEKTDSIFARFKDKNYPFISFHELIKSKDTKKHSKITHPRKNKKNPKLKTKIEIILKNGDVLSGRVLFKDDKKIILETTLGEVIEIGKSEIQKIK